ncbi:MAG: hypothetical protein HYY23_02640 [Verrucomicrobia bacterium]|nr:hypothetical protein [Verrucomicrobiota bacterium]
MAAKTRRLNHFLSRIERRIKPFIHAFHMRFNERTLFMRAVPKSQTGKALVAGSTVAFALLVSPPKALAQG